MSNQRTQYSRGKGNYHHRGFGASTRTNRHSSGRTQASHHSRAHVTELNLQDDIASIEECGNIDDRTVRIAVQGCSHGCIDRIYEILEEYQRVKGPSHTIDLLLCCGDFQALRNTADYDTISLPAKYREMGSFHQYYSGAKKAPILTVFIGGNHEASGYLQELYYGGWVAPNIYYMGAAGVISFRGIRIAGLSGIYSPDDYTKGRHEEPPYNPSTLRSVYHYRNSEVARLKCLSKTSSSQPIDIFMTHDWPRGIEQYGDTRALLRQKPFFAQEIRENNLGSPAAEEILQLLKPKWWFSAHLHVKFHATVLNHGKPLSIMRSQEEDDCASTTSFIGLESSFSSGHKPPDLTDLMTQFLSLDKCLPRRRHLQVINISSSQDADNVVKNELCYDLEWLSLLRKTHHWTDKSHTNRIEPDTSSISISDEDQRNILERIIQSRDQATVQQHGNFLAIPQNFVMTVLPYGSVGSEYHANGGRMVGNPQTDSFLQILGLNHIITTPYRQVDGATHKPYLDANEINLDEN